ncbi:MAG: Stage III sporulation protein AD [Firmicutes bacterium]|nr:Stage III sporulation protein AD [Bacillota bacterium]
MQMEIFQIVGLGLIAAVLAVLLKQHRPEIALQVSVVTGLIIIMLIMFKLASVLEALQGMAQRINVDTVYISTIFKIVGIAYIAEFGSQVCRDAGETSIASKIELAGKVIIMVLAVPILMALLDLIISIVP